MLLSLVLEVEIRFQSPLIFLTALQEEEEYRHIYVCRNRKIDVTDVVALKSMPFSQLNEIWRGLMCLQLGL